MRTAFSLTARPLTLKDGERKFFRNQNFTEQFVCLTTLRTIILEKVEGQNSHAHCAWSMVCTSGIVHRDDPKQVKRCEWSHCRPFCKVWKAGLPVQTGCRYEKKQTQHHHAVPTPPCSVNTTTHTTMQCQHHAVPTPPCSANTTMQCQLGREEVSPPKQGVGCLPCPKSSTFFF